MNAERHNVVLVVSDKENTAEYFRSLLPPGRFSRVDRVFSSSEAKRIAAESQYDIIIIDTPFENSLCTRLAAELSQSGDVGIILLTPIDLYEETVFKTDEFGIITLSKPLDDRVVFQTVNAVGVMVDKLKLFRTKSESLKTKMDEIKAVNRAKLLLMEKRGMNEAQAHRFIEKAAMDRCVKRREIADIIIKTEG